MKLTDFDLKIDREVPIFIWKKENGDRLRLYCFGDDDYECDWAGKETKVTNLYEFLEIWSSFNEE